jgi:hypothetical protein
MSVPFRYRRCPPFPLEIQSLCFDKTMEQYTNTIGGTKNEYASQSLLAVRRGP